MLFYYGMKTLTEFLSRLAPELRISLGELATRWEGDHGGRAAEKDRRITEWVNLGGQIVPAFRVDLLRRDIRERRVDSWEGIHRRYEEMAASYEEDRLRHAWAVLKMLRGEGEKPLTERGPFTAALDEALRISGWIRDQVFFSRAKDFHDPFRSITYRNQEEMDQVAGRAEDNSFVRLAEEKHRRFTEKVELVRAGICQ
jgi:hypothetical protein